MIHPTAIVDPLAQIGHGTIIGPYALIEGAVILGPDNVIQGHAKLIGPMTMGRGNRVHSFAVLGDAPQDLKFRDQQSGLIIGDSNIFREHVTVHRGTGGNTVIGSENFLMVACHVGHNSHVGNHVTLVNGSLLAGHVVVQDRAIIGGNCGIHQFCRIGRLAMVSHSCSQTVDIPPFCMATNTNVVAQLNSVGVRRSGMTLQSQNAIRRMFRWAYRTSAGVPLAKALAELPADLLQVPEIQEFVKFVATSKRGVARFRPWSSRHGLTNGSDEADAE